MPRTRPAPTALRKAMRGAKDKRLSQRRPEDAKLLAPTKKSGWHHGNLRTEMVERGMELLELRGAAELSLRELARLAGVSQMAPAHHFGDKGGLLAAIATGGFRTLLKMRLAALRDGMTKEERLRVVMRAYVQFALERTELFHLMFGSYIPNKRDYPELMEASAASFEFLSNSIAEFTANREESDRPPRFSAVVVWSGMHGLATLLSDSNSGFCQIPSTLIDDVCETAANILLGGIRNPQVSITGHPKRTHGSAGAD